jgi:hypothetical protein
MTGLPPLLTLFMIAAFCIGGAVFSRTAVRRPSYVALIGWGLCGAVVMALGWAACMMQAPPRVAIFTGVILPVWLMGGLIGMIAGLILRALRT